MAGAATVNQAEEWPTLGAAVPMKTAQPHNTGGRARAERAKSGAVVSAGTKDSGPTSEFSSGIKEETSSGDEATRAGSGTSDCEQTSEEAHSSRASDTDAASSPRDNTRWDQHVPPSASKATRTAPTADDGNLKIPVLCVYYARGRCTNGTNCRFSHGDKELQHVVATISENRSKVSKTKLCRFYSTGRCLSGTSCLFAHGDDDLRGADGRRGASAQAAPPCAMAQEDSSAKSVSSEGHQLKRPRRPQEEGISVWADPPSVHKDQVTKLEEVPRPPLPPPPPPPFQGHRHTEVAERPPLPSSPPPPPPRTPPTAPPALPPATLLQQASLASGGTSDENDDWSIMPASLLGEDSTSSPSDHGDSSCEELPSEDCFAMEAPPGLAMPPVDLPETAEVAKVERWDDALGQWVVDFIELEPPPERRPFEADIIATLENQKKELEAPPQPERVRGFSLLQSLIQEVGAPTAPWSDTDTEASTTCSEDKQVNKVGEHRQKVDMSKQRTPLRSSAALFVPQIQNNGLRKQPPLVPTTKTYSRLFHGKGTNSRGKW